MRPRQIAAATIRSLSLQGAEKPLLSFAFNRGRIFDPMSGVGGRARWAHFAAELSQTSDEIEPGDPARKLSQLSRERLRREALSPEPQRDRVDFALGKRPAEKERKRPSFP